MPTTANQLYVVAGTLICEEPCYHLQCVNARLAEEIRRLRMAIEAQQNADSIKPSARGQGDA